MNTPFLTLAAAALVVAGTVAPTEAQHSSGGQMMPPDQRDHMMQQGTPGMMGPGMMGPGMVAPGMVRHGIAHGRILELMFAIMDADGDGALSLAEFQEIQARIFAHVDADNDGKVTLEETRAFLRGPRFAPGSDE